MTVQPACQQPQATSETTSAKVQPSMALGFCIHERDKSTEKQKLTSKTASDSGAGVITDLWGVGATEAWLHLTCK